MTAFENVLAEVFEQGAETRMTVEEERLALAKAQLGDQDATIALVYAYAPALRNAASSYRSAGGAWGGDSEDLRTAAIEGLLEAIHAFDPTSHDRLAAIIAGYLADAVSTSIVGPIAFSIPSRTLKRFYGILRAAGGNVYEAAALAPAYEMKTETFLAVFYAVRNVDSLDVDHGTDESERWNRADVRPLWDGKEADVEDAILVEAAFQAVDSLEADVVRLAYGFSDFDPVPDAEIAHRLGFSRQKVQRTRTGALEKMRAALAV
jgi:DNA-directed RNA polymerase specialized sigma subunit